MTASKGDTNGDGPKARGASKGTRGASGATKRGATRGARKGAGATKRGATQGAPKAAGATTRIAKRVAPKAAGATKRIAKLATPKAIRATTGVAKAAKPDGGPVSTVARTVARKALKAMARGALHAGAAGARAVADRAAQTGRDVVESSLSRRLPIQVSIDVAVPLNVAWGEWTTFESMTEGVHRIEDVERDGDHLHGRTAPPHSEDWEAEIIDERPRESFAWRSVKGSDCAGLVTFHRLSDRLTRIELDLDVLPTNPMETFALALHVAHHRVDAELRRFKARVEFINPDVYEASDEGKGPETDTEQE